MTCSYEERGSSSRSDSTCGLIREKLFSVDADMQISSAFSPSPYAFVLFHHGWALFLLSLFMKRGVQRGWGNLELVFWFAGKVGRHRICLAATKSPNAERMREKSSTSCFSHAANDGTGLKEKIGIIIGLLWAPPLGG